MGKTVFIGVDPGINGAIAAVTGDGELIGSHDLPVLGTGRKREINIPHLRRIVAEMVGDAKAHACVERVSARPGQGVVSMFRFGRATGQAEGLLAGLLVPVIRVIPQKWRKAMAVTSGAENKEASVLSASQLFMGADFTRKKDHNRAEAALIAEFCRRHHQRMED
tara:strand:+ start:747 stop:1241 length:495 start_codon:yes stop_codon:yes gene_type:complete